MERERDDELAKGFFLKNNNNNIVSIRERFDLWEIKGKKREWTPNWSFPDCLSVIARETRGFFFTAVRADHHGPRVKKVEMSTVTPGSKPHQSHGSHLDFLTLPASCLLVYSLRNACSFHQTALNKRPTIWKRVIFLACWQFENQNWASIIQQWWEKVTCKLVLVLTTNASIPHHHGIKIQSLGNRHIFMTVARSWGYVIPICDLPSGQSQRG